MDKYKNIDISEYFPLILVLSFLVLHNIYLVISGIMLSILTLNKEKINKYIKSNKIKKKENIKEKIENKNSKELIKENSVLTLVEKIEELGFIPSKDNEDDNYAA